MNNFTVPVSLVNKLKNITDYSIIAVEANECYGKVLIFNSFLENIGVVPKFISVVQGNEDMFMSDFAKALCDDKQLVNSFINSPINIASFRGFIEEACECDTDRYIIVDGYEHIDNEFNGHLMEVFSNYASRRIHLFLMSNFSFSGNIYSILLRSNNIIITGSDITLSQQDIIELFDNNKVKIYKDMAATIYDKTLGWASLVAVALRRYAQNSGTDLSSAYDRIINSTLWNKISEDQKNALILGTMLNKFTKSQIMMVLNDEEIYRQTIDLNRYVYFDSEQRTYTIHPILQERAMEEYNEYTIEKKLTLLNKTVDIFMSIGNYFDAIKYMYISKNFEPLIYSKVKFSDIYPYVNNGNKDIFLTLLSNIPQELRFENIPLIIDCGFILFLLNEKKLMQKIYNMLDNYFEQSGDYDEKNSHLARYYYTKGITGFNDIDCMMQYFIEANQVSQEAVVSSLDNIPMNFGVLSIVNLFHKNMGEIHQECEALNKCMPFYYRITNGHGKGLEASFEAEINYLSCNFKEAEIFCIKTAYMADTRNQYAIFLSSIIILMSLAIYEADYDKFDYYLSAVINKEKKIKEKFPEIVVNNVIDLFRGRLRTLIDSPVRFPSWLTDWETIENNTNMISQCYANIIYGKYLLLNKEYKKYIGISTQLLGLSAIHGNILARIYFYIYLCIAQANCDEPDLADKYLRTAIDYSIEDNIIMPFVENYSFIEEQINTLSFEGEYRDFVKKIKTSGPKFSKGKEYIRRKFDNATNYGLTAREYEVAKLAASRLSNKEIAKSLFIAESTVKSNLKEIFAKLSISSRTELYDKF